MYNKIKRVITVLFILFLLFVFIAPHHYLNKSCDAFLALIDEAAEASDPGEALEELDALYREKSKILLAFLTHEEVDALGAEVAAAVPLREEESLSSALAGLREGVEALRHVEQFSWEAIC
jgi:hypothetical protein